MLNSDNIVLVVYDALQCNRVISGFRFQLFFYAHCPMTHSRSDSVEHLDYWRADPRAARGKLAEVLTKAETHNM